MPDLLPRRSGLTLFRLKRARPPAKNGNQQHGNDHQAGRRRFRNSGRRWPYCQPRHTNVEAVQNSPPVVVKLSEEKVPTNSTTPEPSLPIKVSPDTVKHVLHPPQYAEPWLRIKGAASKL